MSGLLSTRNIKNMKKYFENDILNHIYLNMECRSIKASRETISVYDNLRDRNRQSGLNLTQLENFKNI